MLGIVVAASMPTGCLKVVIDLKITPPVSPATLAGLSQFHTDTSEPRVTTTFIPGGVSTVGEACTGGVNPQLTSW
jgi:hypothetical protein